jgi:hypothetical protein
MQKISDPKLITCIIPHHKTLQIIEELAQDKGIIMANKSSARGSSYTTDFEWVEMEVLEVIVQADKADETFSYLFEVGEIDKPHGGLIFQHALSRASDYKLTE